MANVTEWDWRSQPNVVTPVKNQGAAGCCCHVLLLLLLLLLPLCCCSVPPLPAPRLYIRSLSLTRARTGTCWAFSATENIESVWALAGNALTPLSG